MDHERHTMNASQFIRSQPSDTPAKTVIAAGEKKGLTFNAALVNVVRWRAKQTGKPKPKKRSGPGRPKGSRNRPRNGGSDATFRALVMELGVASSRDLLTDVERAVAQIVAG
jgi:hypothetical protein